ncbi:MAG: cobyric acid synthase [Clostridium sp.]|nr:cobyric acid synthase [Clostridium sp.]
MKKSWAKPIMIQGTMSNAGKSMLASGLCRIFAQDGYRVAPFKSQNMALNSFITAKGLEMGRAQAVQAEAAGIPPSVDMNPILLKPTTDVGSQVIVNGISRGNMKAKEYFAFKKELIPEILAAYNRLAEACDIIVIEGAGSPAEINLKEDDIVNMGMAEMAKAPVLLAGDIDRGGVFAQLYGTVALLSDAERARIKGLIINKFRGDKSILDPGCEMLEELCHIPVVGVVPYMDIDLEDEDSLSPRLEPGEGSGTAGIDLAVIRFPRISNFTDFNVFSSFPGVRVRYVSRLPQLGNPDMVFLPGTKSTIEDLMWFRQSGLESAVLKLADRQVPLWGICGGYQMMGEKLTDGEGVEACSSREEEGMGLLPLRTEFHREKTRTQVEGSFGELDGCLEPLSGRRFTGYEIHMGQSEINRENGVIDTARLCTWRPEPEICRPAAYLMEVQDKKEPTPESRRVRTDGWNRGNIYGSYVHGIFDGPGIAQAVIKALADKKGVTLEEMERPDYKAYREKQYDKLADVLRETLDMEKIYDMMGLEYRR